MLPSSLWLLCFSSLYTWAQTTNDEITFSQTFSTISAVPTSDFGGSQYTYISPDGQSTVSSSSNSIEFLSGTQNSSTRTGSTASTSSQTNSQITRTATLQSLFAIAGSTSTAGNGTNSTASRTSSSALPSNTLPCNNYPEFCNRKYSNITEVCAHNSAFVVKNNAASNQNLPIIDQLNDGVRMCE
jgi:hypothetical protein